MKILIGHFLSVLVVLLLTSCGGGDSSVTTVACKNAFCDRLDPAVGTFSQRLNNMQLKVEDGPRGFTYGPNANILYATVKVCKPGADADIPGNCQTIDKVIVDTGSVGLRVLASQVKNLGLEPAKTKAGHNAWECFPFVVGGLWGANVAADVLMGPLRTARPVSVQLIEEGLEKSLFKAPDFCLQWAQGELYDSAISLGANGILGIGSTNLDCGGGCVDLANYSGIEVQYYGCPLDATDSTGCIPGEVGLNQQVSNPIAALQPPYNGGFVLAMPAVTDPGAATATGELIFGVETIAGSDSYASNMVPSGVTKVFLGVDYLNNFASYLNITTEFNGRTYVDSYLDTGTNYLRFTDDLIPLCPGDPLSYCPTDTTSFSAIISNGDDPLLNRVGVWFQVGNSDNFIVTKNTAFGSLAAAVNTAKPSEKNYTTFAWGMPFFYGKRVHMSIWDITQWDPVTGAAINPPWYAWTTL